MKIADEIGALAQQGVTDITMRVPVSVALAIANDLRHADRWGLEKWSGPTDRVRIRGRIEPPDDGFPQEFHDYFRGL